jgi:hypothetical protein
MPPIRWRSPALWRQLRSNPAIEVFRDSAREIVATDPRAAETFIACAEIFEKQIGAVPIRKDRSGRLRQAPLMQICY